MVLCSEVAMTDAEKESEARCKAMLSQLISAVKKQTMEMEDLAVRMNELAVGLKTLVQPRRVPDHTLPPSVTAPTPTLVVAVDHAVAAAAPVSDAALAPESPTRCTTSGPDPNAGCAKVTVVSLLSRGVTTAIRAQSEPAYLASSNSFATGELDNRMPAGCSMIGSGDDTASQTSAFMPDAAPGSPSTTTLLDVAITSPKLAVVTIRVRDDTGDLTAHQLLEEMPPLAQVDSTAWLRLSARPTFIFASTGVYLARVAPPYIGVRDMCYLVTNTGHGVMVGVFPGDAVAGSSHVTLLASDRGDELTCTHVLCPPDDHKVLWPPPMKWVERRSWLPPESQRPVKKIAETIGGVQGRVALCYVDRLRLCIASLFNYWEDEKSNRGLDSSWTEGAPSPGINVQIDESNDNVRTLYLERTYSVLEPSDGRKLENCRRLIQDAPFNGRKLDAADATYDRNVAVDVLNGSDFVGSTMSGFEDKKAWDFLRESVVYYCSSPVGTIAANDPKDSNPANYDQVFIRDFIPSGVAFLLKGEYEIVHNFILHTLQSWEKTMDCHSPGQGLMPASFKVRTIPLDGDEDATEEVLDPDFGEAAIGRVAPVDSGLWWIILLRAYGKCSGDLSVQERIDVQTGIKMILKLCLADGFDMFPTLLVTDGSCMIDRRMGIHGHPLEIQALFYSALLCAREMLTPEDGSASADLIRALNNRLIALSFHIREYYWVDMQKLNEIYRYKTEEYSYDAVNKFNIYPDQVSPWLVEWIPPKGGYFIGNLQPAHMDFRFFSLGNLWSIVSSLATTHQSHAILDLIESKWFDLVAEMPLKLCYPALENQEWKIITGSDPKNTPWSYHNGGSWPTLLWQLTVACIKMNRPEIAARAVEIAEKRIATDKWPEYYDTKRARFIGKQSRLYQTWSIAGYLVAKLLLEKPDAARILWNDEDAEILNALSTNRKRGKKVLKKTYIV